MSDSICNCNMTLLIAYRLGQLHSEGEGKGLQSVIVRHFCLLILNEFLTPGDPLILYETCH